MQPNSIIEKDVSPTGCYHCKEELDEHLGYRIELKEVFPEGNYSLFLFCSMQCLLKEYSKDTIESFKQEQRPKIEKMKGIAFAIRVVVTAQGITTKTEQEAAIEDLKDIENLASEILGE